MTAGRRLLLWRAVCREGPLIKRGRGKVFLGGYRRLAGHIWTGDPDSSSSGATLQGAEAVFCHHRL